jgi:hypothetical protein
MCTCTSKADLLNSVQQAIQTPDYRPAGCLEQDAASQCEQYLRPATTCLAVDWRLLCGSKISAAAHAASACPVVLYLRRGYSRM